MPPKVMLVVGTRPEAIKLCPVINALRKRGKVEVTVCATGQHRELLDQALRFAGIAPDLDLAVMEPEQSLDGLSARLLIEVGRALDAERPARIVVQGDTTSAMMSALAAHYRGIAVSHVEAGLRSGKLWSPHPEEANRRIISAIANQHFTPTRAEADALLREGIPADCVAVTGNTVIDALLAARDRIAAEPSLAASLDPLMQRFADKQIIAVTTHRRESRGGATRSIAEALKLLAGRADVGIVIPIHPAAAVRTVLTDMLSSETNVALVEPLDYPCFVRLLMLCRLVLTDSGGIQEEAPVFGKPVLVMRDVTERPQAIEAGTAKLVGTSTATIVRETTRLLDDELAYAQMARASSPFGDGRSSVRIAERIERAVCTPEAGISLRV